ncbi:hypothetical protein V8E51_004789 [Hyaloscypha variabilis]
MASQAQSLPGSPQGYTNQIRRPHPSADYQTQLACFLLNHLQENLEPLIGRDTNFFNVPYRIHHTLYSHGISSLSQAATLVGLESLGQLFAIHVNIRVHKYIGGEKNYLVEAIAEGHDTPGNVPLGEVISCGGKKLRAAVCIGWKVIDEHFGSGIDDMCWNDVLTLLRKASKKVYNQFGELRSDEEAAQVDIMLGSWFGLGNDLEMETFVRQAQPGNIRRSNIRVRHYGTSNWGFYFVHAKRLVDSE